MLIARIGQLRLVRSVFIHVPLSRVPFALARLSCFLCQQEEEEIYLAPTKIQVVDSII